MIRVPQLRVVDEFKTEDWSELAKREICINEEDVKRIVLVVSNSNTENLFDGLVKVDGRSSGCSGWRGTMSATHTWNTADGYRGTATSTFEGLWSAAPASVIPFVQCRSPNGDDCTYYLPAGTIKWTWDAHTGNSCDETTSGSLPAGSEEHPEQQLFVIEPVDENHLRYYGNGAFVIPPLSCMHSIGGYDPFPPAFFALDRHTAPDKTPGAGEKKCSDTSWQIEATAESISGSCFANETDYDSQFFEWDLQRVGPAPGG